MIVYYITLFLILLVIASFYILIKNNNTYKRHNQITMSIYYYNMDVVNNPDNRVLISYDCMENYYKTLFRVFDWGYKKIVPWYVLNRIEEYMDKKSGGISW